MYQTPFHEDNLSNKSFLITGGAGFIGSHLVEYLAKYNAKRIVVLDNFSTGYRSNLLPFEHNPSLEILEGDVCDFDTCLKATQNIDYVLHQAALGSVPRSVKDPITTNKVNVDGFVNVLTAAKNNQVKRIVYASSSSVYGDSPILPKTEDVIGNPLSPYAVSKLTNELYAEVFAKTYGMEIVGLRYFNIFGPRQSPKGPYAAVIPLFMQAAIEETSIAYINGNGKQTRDFTFVENAVQANIKALFAPLEKNIKQIYNVAVGQRININDLYFSILALSNNKKPPQYREARAGDIQDSLANIEKAKKYLNYSPSINLQEGLQKTYEWYLNNKNT